MRGHMTFDRTVTQIWELARRAIDAKMRPEQFKKELAEAWAYHLEEDAKDAKEELLK